MINAFQKLTGFGMKDGVAQIEDCDLPQLARTYGTPLYIYSRKALQESITDWSKEIAGTNHRVFYAMKANSTRAILQEFIRAGFGFDIVSGGELARALAAGAKAENIIYSGVGKTVEELKAAIKAGILCFNVESESELYRISNICNELNKEISISLRVNPDVDAKTHPYISTGLKNNKFGVDYSQAIRLFKIAKTLPYIKITGIDCHIGSQLTELQPFLDAAEKIIDLIIELKQCGINLDHVDCGGGLGIDYNGETPPSASELIRSLKELFTRRGLSELALFFEPGRSLVAKAGMLLTEVQYLKPTPNKNFCIVDASMTDMIRPSLYGAKMPLYNCYQRSGRVFQWDIVGPVCESGDWLSKQQELCVVAGDILAQPNAGAYGSTMSSNYNSRPLCAEVLVDKDKPILIKRRQTYDEIMQNEITL